MLRSALSAAVRALREPARALDVLGHYTRSVEGALATTAFQAVVDTHEKIINYSSAGHLPPFLAHPDGTFRALDQATDPPLGALPEHTPSPHAALPYAPGDTLVLYTDGLVERRGEDIDAGLRRLTDTLARSVHLSPERLADELLTSLGVGTGSNDDIALIVIRL
jgi:serine phosphatase RsbU (regulator of sigma subunit)